MTMKLKQEIQSALTAAMKARDEETKRTLRLVMTAIKLAEVEVGRELDDARILGILQKEVKTRQDTIEEVKKVNRIDLTEAAEREIKILNRFLPQQMEEKALIELANEVIEEIKASSLRDMGEVMKHLMPKLAGRASGQVASQIVRDLLQDN